MQLFSKASLSFPRTITFLSHLLVLYTFHAAQPTSAQPQLPTRPRNDLEPVSVTAVSERSTGLSSVTVEFLASDLEDYYQLNCRIVFHSLMGPPEDYVSR